MPLRAREVVSMASQRGLEVQFEIGKKHGGRLTRPSLMSLSSRRNEVAAGAVEVVVEARESAQDVGLFETNGKLNQQFADRFAEALTLPS
jgi:phosphosulfolactate synthase